MRRGFRDVMIAVTTAAVVAALSLAVSPSAGQIPSAGQTPTAGQFPPFKASRAADGKADLNGIWQALTTANWDIQDHQAQAGLHPEIMGAYGAQPAGQGIVEGGEIPYRPEALARKTENFQNRNVVNMTSDPRRHDTGDQSSSVFGRACRAPPICPFRFRLFRVRSTS